MNLFSYIKNRYLTAKLNSVVVTSYFLFILSSFVYFSTQLDLRNMFLCFLFSTFILLAYWIEYQFKIKFPPLFLFGMFTIATGAILGSCYNVYSYIPFFDTFLHGLTGFLIPCLGFALMHLLVKDLSSKRQFFACLIFAIGFSLSITVVWEVFEYLINSLFGYDMLADTIVYDINSYYLSGDHNVLYSVNDINKTIIYYGDNKILTLNGYLDIGLIDTLHDMIIHLICTILFTITSVISYYKCPKINKLLIPEI